MQWIRSRASFANVISLIALFVALGGTAYAGLTLPKNSVGAKQIKKNAVRASDIRKNAVSASEIKRNAVGASEIRSNAVAGDDVADGSLGSGDLGDNSVGASEVSNDSLTAEDIVGSSLDAETGPDAYARLTAAGNLLASTGTFPSTSKNIVAANVTHPAVGVYCFINLPFMPASGMVALDNATAPFNTAAQSNYAASIATERGAGLGGCPAGTNARVQTTRFGDTLAPAFVDHPFVVWFER